MAAFPFWAIPAPDNLRGGIGNNTLLGGSQNDILLGGADNNSLNGGSGRDTLIGNEGADTLFGGGQAGEFRYVSVADSLNSPARDSILDFAAGVDVINLSALAGPPLAMAIGGAFKGIGANARTLETRSGNTLVLVDIDGNSIADFRVDVIGTTGLTLGDFLL